ncbi:ubiquitin-like protein 3 isoform X1 [Gallus gallus]|uniref:ubiquitin-like protein 3 isoform X1 n=1 Tax=Gallus gallus TaxID=9031 RepID=UPI001F01B3BA|nr:ubiquitin-like protein 3 isoform X1 [Gallus gallus]XP_046797854.1 ubiquitin-like protein 3 isoform X1 [Gallus gallus]
MELAQAGRHRAPLSSPQRAQLCDLGALFQMTGHMHCWMRLLLSAGERLQLDSQVGRMNWEEEQVSSPNILRLIYQGRFLHGNVTLGALKLPFGKTTVMHLVARETLPEPNSQGQRNREKTGESNCCVIL